MALLWKMIFNLGDPMSLRHPVHTNALTHMHKYTHAHAHHVHTKKHRGLGREFKIHNYVPIACVAVCCSILQRVAV